MDQARTQGLLHRAARDAGVRDPRVLDAVERVPRAWFLPASLRHWAHQDAPLGIGHGQTTSQPSLVARILEDLRVVPGAMVLEVGTGLGYEASLATLLAAPGGMVITVERDARLAAKAHHRLQRLAELPDVAPGKVHVRVGDGASGVPEHAPYDAIIVAAACEQVPEPLFEQLADGGRLIAPVEREGGTHLLRYERHGSEVGLGAELGFVRYVPLVPGVTGERPLFR